MFASAHRVEVFIPLPTQLSPTSMLWDHPLAIPGSCPALSLTSPTSLTSLLALPSKHPLVHFLGNTCHLLALVCLSCPLSQASGGSFGSHHCHSNSLINLKSPMKSFSYINQHIYPYWELLDAGPGTVLDTDNYSPSSTQLPSPEIRDSSYRLHFHFP